MSKPCPTCNGDGRHFLQEEGESCLDCNGSGVVEATEAKPFSEVEMHILRQFVELPGMGEYSYNNTPFINDQYDTKAISKGMKSLRSRSLVEYFKGGMNDDGELLGTCNGIVYSQTEYVRKVVEAAQPSRPSLETKELDDLEEWLRGSFEQFLYQDGSSYTSAAARIAADYGMRRVQALIERERQEAEARGKFNGYHHVANYMDATPDEPRYLVESWKEVRQFLEMQLNGETK